MAAVRDTNVVQRSTKFVSQQWLTKGERHKYSTVQELQLNAGVYCPGKVFLHTLYYC
jgi:hypothetical protein